ncbi:myelin transcription factor 1 [Carassius auratus]|uniref:Myelin transcription factor 1 n=1 Tax=Carassius auratus TaxID=7957 RepID=A0A6P6QQ33_CARAU|nr:myelin transcription factor 1-like [Carassius auratus]
MSRGRRSTHFWSEEETDLLLQTLKQMNIDRYTDGRKHRNSLIFRKVCARHREAGFARSCDQVKHRWKTLKAIYYKAKRQCSGSSFRHFDTMEEIFGHRPLVLHTTPDSGDEQRHERALPDSRDEQRHGRAPHDSRDEQRHGRAPHDSRDEEEEEEEDEEEEDDVLEEVEGGVQELQSVKMEDEPLVLTQASHESSSTSTESPSAAPGVLKRRRSCCAGLHSQYQGFLERLQQTQNAWLEQQLEQSHVREERLVTQVLAEHTRSMEALVNQLFAGLRSLLPPSCPHPQTSALQSSTPES